MRFCMSHSFAAFFVISTNIVVLPVNGQCTLQSCEFGEPSISIVTEIQEIKNQLDIIIKSLQTVDRRSQEQDVRIKRIENQVFGIDDWMVIMNRYDGSLDFNRSWTDYRNGFGEKERGEFWLGNEKVHRLTNRFDCSLRIEVQFNTSGEWKYAEYSSFTLDSEDNKYTIHLSGYSGNAGDGLADSDQLSTDFYHGGMYFTTWDRDNDRWSYNCAKSASAGWWFNACIASCLTCKEDFRWYFPGSTLSNRNLRSARMMINSN